MELEDVAVVVVDLWVVLVICGISRPVIDWFSHLCPFVVRLYGGQPNNRLA